MHSVPLTVPRQDKKKDAEEAKKLEKKLAKKGVRPVFPDSDGIGFGDGARESPGGPRSPAPAAATPIKSAMKKSSSSSLVAADKPVLKKKGVSFDNIEEAAKSSSKKESEKAKVSARAEGDGEPGDYEPDFYPEPQGTSLMASLGLNQVTCFHNM